MRKQQREAILALLEETYKGTETALHYSTPFELLVAVIMSGNVRMNVSIRSRRVFFRNIIRLKKWVRFRRNSWKKKFVTAVCSVRRPRICWRPAKCW